MQLPVLTRWIIQAFAAEYIRVSMLGVNNMNTMTECTAVLP